MKFFEGISKEFGEYIILDSEILLKSQKSPLVDSDSFYVTSINFCSPRESSALIFAKYSYPPSKPLPSYNGTSMHETVEVV